MARKKSAEGELQQKFVNFLKRHNEVYYKTWGGMAGGFGKSYSLQAGWPDLVVFDKEPNTIIMIELKDTKGKLTLDQCIKFGKLLDLGHCIYILRTENWNNFKTIYKEKDSLKETCEFVLHKVNMEDIEKRLPIAKSEKERRKTANLLKKSKTI